MLLNASKPGRSASYIYDPLGRRSAKTVDTILTSFLHDGVEEIADYDGGGTLLRRYVHGPGVDEYLVMYTGSGTSNKSYFHANHQGSIIAMSDGTGTVTEQHSYDAYGNSDDLTGNPFRYTGRRLDEETGLYYYRARYYSPAIGRFLQTDPIGYGDGLNWYVYVQNDPVNKTDPSGNLAQMPPCGNNSDGLCLHVQDRKGGSSGGGSGGKSNFSSDPTPPGPYDQITPNATFRDNISVTSGEGATTLEMKFSVSIETTAAHINSGDIIDGIMETWNKSFMDNGHTYNVTLALTKVGGGVFGTGGDLVLKTCKSCPGGVMARGDLGGKNMYFPRAQLSKIKGGLEQSALINGHEFGHTLGLSHRANSTNSIMSYSSNGVLKLFEVKLLLGAYGK